MLLPGFVESYMHPGIPGDVLLHNALQALAGMERDGKLPLRYRASGYIDKRDIDGEEVAQNIQQKRRAFASRLIGRHIHAIGDCTLRVALDAVGAARKVAPKSDSRIAVAHAMLVSRDDLRRLKALGVSIQTTPH